MIPGVSSACLYPMETLKAVKILAKLGIKNTEIFVNTISETNDDYIKEIKSVASGSGIKICSIHPYTSAMEGMYFFSNYETRFNDGVEIYKRYFHMAASLGAKLFVLHGAPKVIKMENKLYFDRFEKLRLEAEKFGVILAQENVERSKSGSLDFLLEMEKSLPEARFVFDVKQAVRAKSSPFDFVNSLGKSIIHIHLSDNDENRECVPLGEGNFNIKDFLLLAKEKTMAENVVIELYRDNFLEEKVLSENYELLKNILKTIN